MPIPNKLNCTKMTHTRAFLFPEIHFKHQQSFYLVGFLFIFFLLLLFFKWWTQSLTDYKAKLSEQWNLKKKKIKKKIKIKKKVQWVKRTPTPRPLTQGSKNSGFQLKYGSLIILLSCLIIL